MTENPGAKDRYDLVIVGAGPAGLAAAEAAADAGLSVALVERHKLGGNSLNVGSIPSKTMIRSAFAANARRGSREVGLAGPADAVIDFGIVAARMREVRSRIGGYHSIDRLQSRNIDVFFAEARFCGRRSLLAGNVRLNFKKALIATGSQPRMPRIPGIETCGYLTSETIFDIAAVPPRLAIIGGGPLGCELAQAFRRLGSHVTLLQSEPTFLPLEERDAAEILSLVLSRDGVDTHLNTTVTGAALGDGGKRLETDNYGMKQTITADEVLLSIGRTPNVEGLHLSAAGIEYDSQTGIKVDDFLRTSNANVFSAGDVCMTHKFANVAEATGRMAVLNGFSPRRKRKSHLLIPWCTYCDPEIAHIGMQVPEARSKGVPVKTFTIMMGDVDRAITDRQDEGFVKLHVREGTDEILGATIVATRASEMINEVSVLMNARIGMRRLAHILHTYPAQSDAIRLAGMAFLRNEKNFSIVI